MQPYEQYLQETILLELEKGRPGWDKPHTEKVVLYAKKISEARGDVNTDVLVITAYLHDFGYMYFKDEHQKGSTRKGKAKKAHAKYSLKKWKQIEHENCFNFLTTKQRQRIEHIVLVHDNVYDLKETDELVFMEADTLGAWATVNVNTNYAHWRYWFYILRIKQKRISRFITPWAKEEASRLINEVILPKTVWYNRLRAHIFNIINTLSN